MNNELGSLYAKMELKDGVLYGKYYNNITIDLNAAKSVVEHRKQITNYKSTPILVDVRGVIVVDKEARNYFSSKDGTELLSAAALLVDSRLSSFLANFFIKVNLTKSPIPLKVFTIEKEAVEWLNNYR